MTKLYDVSRRTETLLVVAWILWGISVSAMVWFFYQPIAALFSTGG